MKKTIRKHSLWERAVMSALLLCIAQLLVVSSGNAQQSSRSPIYTQPTIGTPNVDVPRTISYQGMITLPDGSVPKDGMYPVTVSLYADDSGATPIWSSTYSSSLSRGIFNIILGSGNDTLPAPNMMNRPIWVGVSFNGKSEARPLSPLSASPYALNVPDQSISASKISANYVGSISVNGKTITGSGSNLNIVANNGVLMNFDSTTSTLFVNSGGTGTKGGIHTLWIGHNLSSSDVDGELNTIPDSSNVIGGGGSNTANPYGPSGGTNGYASILGGYNNTAGSSTQYDAIAGGSGNEAIGGYSNVGGGYTNTASGVYSTVGGGYTNTASGFYSVVGGGNGNSSGGSGPSATVCGGSGNTASAKNSTVGGGAVNTSSGVNSTISGGIDNTAGISSAIAGGIYLTVGANSFGFNNKSTSGGTTDVSGFANPLAYFGNVDLDIGNTDGTNRSLVLWGGNTSLTYSGALSTSLTAGSPTASVVYTLPASAPSGTGYFLTSTTSGGMSWASASSGSAWTLAGNTTSGGEILGTLSGSTNHLLIEDYGNQIATFNGNYYSVILGDHTNGTGTNTYAGIGGGQNNTVSANYGTVPGGLGLNAVNYGQTAVGLYNTHWGNLTTQPSYSLLVTHPPVSVNADYPLFVVGNGISSVSTSDAFEVSYNGHATPTQIFGDYVSTSTRPVQGASYNDNSILAWGQVDFTTGGGHATHDFGVDTVFWAGNVCTIVLNYPGTPSQLNVASITVTGEDDCPSSATSIIACEASVLGGGACKIGIANSFNVATYSIPLGPGHASMSAQPFFFKVCGRH
jgi:hypothetical protein